MCSFLIHTVGRGGVAILTSPPLRFERNNRFSKKSLETSTPKITPGLHEIKRLNDTRVTYLRKTWIGVRRGGPRAVVGRGAPRVSDRKRRWRRRRGGYSVRYRSGTGRPSRSTDTAPSVGCPRRRRATVRTPKRQRVRRSVVDGMQPNLRDYTDLVLTLPNPTVTTADGSSLPVDTIRRRWQKRGSYGFGVGRHLSTWRCKKRKT